MFLSKLLKNQRGTALLTALLVMGVLISVSLALTTLIVREGGLVKGVIDAGRSYYAAESGIEVALYKLNTGLPESVKLEESVELENSTVTFDLNNTCQAYPCFDEDEYDLTTGSIPATAMYTELGRNDSIIIPLFVINENGEELPVGDFTVEFYGAFNPSLHFKDNLVTKNLHTWDVLRWKIFGLDENSGQTESISDFTAISQANLAETNEGLLTNAETPSWFGSVNCTGKADRYLGDVIECKPYLPAAVDIIPTGEFESPIYAGTCAETEAREAYIVGADGKTEVYDCYSIQSFINEPGRKLKYLSLTNLMNPEVFDEQKIGAEGADKEKLSRIFFRVEMFKGDENTGNQTVREFADITASGSSGKATQTINVKIQRGSFMPVFNFSLYSTYKDEAAGHDFNYYYDPDAD